MEDPTCQDNFPNQILSKKVNSLPPMEKYLRLCALLALASPARTMDAVESLNLGAMIRPFASHNVFREDDYFVWCPQVFKEEGGPYHLIYSRWPRSSKIGGWLTQSEVALAAGESPEGPFRHVKTLLRGAGPGHWDELMAHNPKLYRFGNKYYLYYISSRSGPSRGHVRDSQRTGVAVADSILGPYRRSEQPIVEPAAPVFNLTVNPAVTRMTDGRYLMMIKGDITPKLPTEPMPQRVQGLAVADRPEGPYAIRPELAIRDIDTEDASLWHDAVRRSYFAVFHARKYIALIESADGFNWRRAEHYQVTQGNTLPRADGGILSTQAPLQRPDLFIENGKPCVLALGIPEENNWHCVMVPLAPKRKGPATAAASSH